MTADFMTSKNEHKVILTHLQDVIDRNVPGSILELGCHNGNTTIMIQRLLKLNNLKREVVVYDSFKGFPDVAHEADKGWGKEGDLKTSVSKFKKVLKRAKVPLPRIEKGFFSDIPESKFPPKIAFVFFDGDLYQSTLDALARVHRKMSPGGVIVFDDFKNPQQNMYPGVEKACKVFYGEKNSVNLVNEHILEITDPFFHVKPDTISQAVIQYKQ